MFELEAPPSSWIVIGGGPIGTELAQGFGRLGMFFPGKDKPAELVRWCTFTDPELAHAGLTVAEARERFGKDARAATIDLTRSDRARAEAETEGRIVLALRRDKVVGAHVLAPSAGELIHKLVLAIRKGMRLRKLLELVHVYPTISTSISMLAGGAATENALRHRWLVRRESA